MATAAQLYAARNAGLNLANVCQPYAQSDLILANEANTEARAEVKAVADAAVTAAVAIGGVVVLPATQAVVANAQKVNAGTVTGTGNFATFTVAGGVITGIVLSAS